MFAYILRRMVFVPFIWLAVTLIIFILIQLLGPYQRLALYTSVNPESFGTKLTPEQIHRIVVKYELDQPFHVQYVNWLKNAAHGNLGWSKTAQAPVIQAIAERFPITLEIALFAMLPVVLIAIVLGINAAVYRGHWPDQLTRAVTITGAALPGFVFALVGLLIFYGFLGWFPPGRLTLWAEQIVFSDQFHRYTGMVTVDAILNGRTDILVDAMRHLFLPIVTLSFVRWAGLTQVTRSAMLEALNQDYVTAARAKGVPERSVIYSHARRNAMIPVTTIGVGSAIGLLLGAFITEWIFNIRGLGFLGVQATLNYDVPTILGIAIFDSGIIVLISLVQDVLYTIVDPRVRFN